jgi:hypothetical protein
MDPLPGSNGGGLKGKQEGGESGGCGDFKGLDNNHVTPPLRQTQPEHAR